MQSKKYILPLIVLGMLAVGVIGWAGVTHAANSSSSSQTIIDKLAAKFNLKKTDVQTVFDEQRQERQKQRKTEMTNRLDEAVKKGVISKDQEQKLIQKYSDLDAKRQKEAKDLQQWYEDNGIDQSKLSPYLGHGHCGGHRMMRHGF